MAIKLLAMDMDDTLLDDRREISARNRAAITRAVGQRRPGYGGDRQDVSFGRALCPGTGD